jgi:hypothetical protein
LAQAEEPFEEMKNLPGNATCEMITFNAMSNAIQLQFLKGDDRLSLELLGNSATTANWKIVNGDHEESDIQ